MKSSLDKTKLYLLLIWALGIQATTNLSKDCSSVILGCQTCEIYDDNSTLSASDAYTCTSCQSNLFLDWYDNPTTEK